MLLKVGPQLLPLQRVTARQQDSFPRDDGLNGKRHPAARGEGWLPRQRVVSLRRVASAREPIETAGGEVHGERRTGGPRVSETESSRLGGLMQSAVILWIYSD